MGKGCHYMSLLILHTFFIWVHGTSAMFLIKLAIFLFSDLLVFMSEILKKLDAELFKKQCQILASPFELYLDIFSMRQI